MQRPWGRKECGMCLMVTRNRKKECEREVVVQTGREIEPCLFGCIPSAMGSYWNSLKLGVPWSDLPFQRAFSCSRERMVWNLGRIQEAVWGQCGGPSQKWWQLGLECRGGDRQKWMKFRGSNDGTWWLIGWGGWGRKGGSDSSFRFEKLGGYSLGKWFFKKV